MIEYDRNALNAYCHICGNRLVVDQKRNTDDRMLWSRTGTLNCVADSLNEHPEGGLEDSANVDPTKDQQSIEGSETIVIEYRFLGAQDDSCSEVSVVLNIPIVVSSTLELEN